MANATARVDEVRAARAETIVRHGEGPVGAAARAGRAAGRACGRVAGASDAGGLLGRYRHRRARAPDPRGRGEPSRQERRAHDLRPVCRHAKPPVPRQPGRGSRASGRRAFVAGRRSRHDLLRALLSRRGQARGAEAARPPRPGVRGVCRARAALLAALRFSTRASPGGILGTLPAERRVPASRRRRARRGPALAEAPYGG
jgi:hypothetical protein